VWTHVGHVQRVHVVVAAGAVWAWCVAGHAVPVHGRVRARRGAGQGQCVALPQVPAAAPLHQATQSRASAARAADPPEALHVPWPCVEQDRDAREFSL